MRINKTIILRGKIFDCTQRVVNSIRSWHDGEIILSTWKGQQISIENVDKVILSEDPGPGPVQQCNRQAISYKNGLDASKNELIMVTRTDIEHKKDIFVHYNTLNNYDEKFKIFNNRIVISNMMTINPNVQHPHVPFEKDKYFRVCDWFQIGKISDLYKWCDVLDIFEEYKHSELCTEQLWMCGFIKKNHLKTFDLNNLLLYKFLFWDYLINNFHIINMKTTGLSFNLNWPNQPEDLGCYLMEEEYKNIYINKFGKFE